MENKVLYLDVETNGIGGFNPPKQRIMQISWIYNDDEYNYFVKDVKQVNSDVPHNITVQYCQENGTSWKKIYKELERCLEDTDVLVAHNANFDISCVANELKVRKSSSYSKYKTIIADFLSTNTIICTMKDTKDLCKLKFENGSDGYKYPKLEELYKYFFGELPQNTLHDSLEDCKVLKECYEIYKDM